MERLASSVRMPYLTVNTGLKNMPFNKRMLKVSYKQYSRSNLNYNIREDGNI